MHAAVGSYLINANVVASSHTMEVWREEEALVPICQELFFSDPEEKKTKTNKMWLSLRTVFLEPRKTMKPTKTK